jgi:Flp pilus assembly protein TadG
MRNRFCHRGERGAALVEFALVLPLLAALIFGVIEFGSMYNSLLEVRSAAREGARMAAVDNGCVFPAPTSCSSTAAAQLTDLKTATQARATGLANQALNISVTYPTGTGHPAVGDNVTVCVNYTFHTVTGLFPFLNGITLHSRGVFRLEQVPTFASDAADLSPC